MAKVNLNDFAANVTRDEGLKHSINIGQVKEILRLTFTKLSGMTILEVAEIIRRYKK